MAVAVALVVQRIVTVRLRRPHVDVDDLPPDFSSMGSPLNMLLVAVFATVGAFGAHHASTPLWPWLGYIALGAPLIVVDLRTTYLPNQLMYPLWGAVGLGLLASCLAPGWQPLLLAAALGGVAGYACFWLVWRTSSSFGYGDVRLAAAVGAIAGMGGITFWLMSLTAATALGAIVALIARAFGRHVVAYGPWLWLGPAIAVWLPTGS